MDTIYRSNTDHYCSKIQQYFTELKNLNGPLFSPSLHNENTDITTNELQFKIHDNREYTRQTWIKARLILSLLAADIKALQFVSEHKPTRPYEHVHFTCLPETKYYKFTIQRCNSTVHHLTICI